VMRASSPCTRAGGGCRPAGSGTVAGHSACERSRRSFR
jgi:hypothetical protein